MSSYFVVAAFGLGFASGITISPGESIARSFSIQNVIAPTSDITIEVEIEEGSQYMTLTQGTRFDVGAGDIISIPVTFNVPTNSNIGDVYPAKVSFKTIAGGSSERGTVEFTTGNTKSFDIIVVEKLIDSQTETPEKESVSIWIWVLIIAILIIVIGIIMKANKN